MSIKVTYGTRQANAEIVTLAQAKANSRIEYDTEDDLLQLYLDSVTDEIENYLNHPVILRSGSTIKLSEFKENYQLRFPISITKVEWATEDGTKTEIPNTTEGYQFEDGFLDIKIERPSTFYELIITGDMGYDVAAIPADIKRAALLLFSHSESYRESISLKHNQSAFNLLRQYRLIW